MFAPCERAANEGGSAVRAAKEGGSAVRSANEGGSAVLLDKRFADSSSLRARARGAAAGRDFVGSYLEYHLNFFGKHAKLP